jgi:uncharacterized protein YcfL
VGRAGQRILCGMKPARLFALAVLLVVLAGCASQSVNMSEPRRLVATESDVRLDAVIRTDVLTPATRIPISYDITNNRQTPIAVAELIPNATYDADTRTVMVMLGSEVPGESMLPRLSLIRPGEKKSFSTVASVNLVAFSAAYNPLTPYPRAIRVRLDFLTDPKSFEKLIGIPERAVHDPALAAELFPKWVEQNETVVTNALPMHWRGEPGADSPQLPSAATGSGRRRPPL